jgi:hypothetical protein
VKDHSHQEPAAVLFHRLLLAYMTTLPDAEYTREEPYVTVAARVYESIVFYAAAVASGVYWRPFTHVKDGF